jgi:hypothetical protein
LFKVFFIWICMSSHLICQVRHDYGKGLGRRLPVNFGLLDRCLHIMYLFIYFVRNSDYIVKM